MDRKKFLISGVSLLGLAAIAPSVLGKESSEDEKSCTVSPAETAGPFPTINPSSLVQTSIVGDRTGVALSITITVQNTNDSCNPLEGAIVDIWHCDKDGNYSEYGGTQMQQTDYTAYHFLRGRQTTDANGQVQFVSIFPGWYTSRATHIHVHIYNASGTSLLVTQISFPEGSGSAVELVNAATAYGYTKGMTGYTYNASDNVFSDDSSNAEMCSLSGSVSGGYDLTHTIKVAGQVAGVDEETQQNFALSHLYPNPVEDEANIDITLLSAAEVTIELLDLNGRLVTTPYSDYLGTGTHTLSFERGNLQSGIYMYKVIVESQSGRFEKTNRLIIR